MSQVFGWEIDKRAHGVMISESKISDLVFKCGQTVKDCMETGRFSKMLKNPTNLPPLLAKANERTVIWFKNQSDIKCEINCTKEELQQFDVVEMVNFLPSVSSRVHDMLMSVCPNEFEAFDMTIKTTNGLVEGYKIINILNFVWEAIDLDKSFFGGTFFNQSPRIKVTKESILAFYDDLNSGGSKFKPGDANNIIFFKIVLKDHSLNGLHMARLGESRLKCMFSKKLIDEFRKMNVKGFLYSDFEELHGRVTNMYYKPSRKSGEV